MVVAPEAISGTFPLRGIGGVFADDGVVRPGEREVAAGAGRELEMRVELRPGSILVGCKHHQIAEWREDGSVGDRPGCFVIVDLPITEISGDDIRVENFQPVGVISIFIDEGTVVRCHELADDHAGNTQQDEWASFAWIFRMVDPLRPMGGVPLIVAVPFPLSVSPSHAGISTVANEITPPPEVVAVMVEEYMAPVRANAMGAPVNWTVVAFLREKSS